MKCQEAIKLVAMSALLVAMSAAESHAKNIKWHDIVGVVAAGNVVGFGDQGFTGLPFQTQGIPGGAPWSTLSGGAKVNLENGKVQFEVKGLVLAAGSALGSNGLQIGTTGGVPEVVGTLVCNVNGTANGGTPPGSPSPSAVVDTPAVALSATGDAQFSGKFSSAIPDVCTSDPNPNNVAFLIRITGTGGLPPAGFDDLWIASGAVLDR